MVPLFAEVRAYCSHVKMYCKRVRPLEVKACGTHGWGANKADHRGVISFQVLDHSFYPWTPGHQSSTFHLDLEGNACG